MMETKEVTQKNWNAMIETLKQVNNRITKLEENEVKRDAFISSQAAEIKRLNGVLVASKMGHGPTA